MMAERIAVRHTGGDMACDGVALYLKSALPTGSLIKDSDIEWPDGHTPVQGERLACNACNASIGILVGWRGIYYATTATPAPVEAQS